MASHRSRGAWIEMAEIRDILKKNGSHRSRGAWIEIAIAPLTGAAVNRRIAHAVRGLKS